MEEYDRAQKWGRYYLIALMISALVHDWPGQAKFVNDLTAVEIIPSNSVSVMDMLAIAIQQLICTYQTTRLNPET